MNRMNCDIVIIVIDNNSPDGSGTELESIYKEDKYIEIVINSVNKGFACANNDGYYLAKEKYKSDYIIIMNPDVFLKDKEFLHKLLQRKNTTNNVEIIAPDIILPNGRHQNPFRNTIATEKDIEKIYKYNKHMFILYHIPIINFFVSLILDFKALYKGINKRVDDELIDVTPHGACIIFTPKWVKNESIAFIPDTFLFMEEDYLMQYASRRCYKTMYRPDLVVHHMVHMSIKSSFSNRIKRRIFLTKNMRDSSKKLLQNMRIKQEHVMSKSE